VIDSPVEGHDYPGSLPQLRRWFSSDGDCLDYLDWLRWPDGFVCPACGGCSDRGSLAAHRCADCTRRTSATAGTLFHATRTPLTVWFEAAWLLMASKQGLSALELQRVTGLGSYQTAWAMLHRFRVAMTSTGRGPLTGRVEVDESIYGGVTAGIRGRELGGKALVIGAVERRGPHGFGRARLIVVPDASRRTVSRFLTENIDQDATIITDGWSAYPDVAARLHMAHEAHRISAQTEPAHVVLPGVHRVFSLSKRMLEATYQGGVQIEHLQAYLDEFTFRFNRRTARQRGLLFLRLLEHAVTTPTTGYSDLIAVNRASATRHRPVPATRRKPATLAGTPLERPWRAA